MYSYQRQVGVEVRVARIFNTFGRRMHPNDGRVVSNFIIQALQNKDITQRRGAATRGFYFNVPPGTRTRVAQFRRTSPRATIARPKKEATDQRSFSTKRLDTMSPFRHPRLYGDGSQTRSFQFVDDLVDGLYKLMNSNYSQPVNLGNPDEYTVAGFAETIKKLTGSKSKIVKLPSTTDDPKQRKPDITTAKKHIGWQPQWSVGRGLAETIAYFERELKDMGGEIIPTGPLASKPRPRASSN